VIIDWEWGRWGSPLTDISWVYWFVHLHYSNQASSLFSIFLVSYLAESQIKISSNLLKVHAIERVWNVLFLLNGATEVVQTDWINRLKWTLENDFFY
jgi:thiamine kinase-like enzyme